MEECSGNFPKAVNPDSARKRASAPKTWERAVQKSERYKAKCLPSYPNCQHATKSHRCSTLSMRDVKQFHGNFYSHNDKISQDNFIIKYCEINNIKRRGRTGNKSYKKNFSVKYKFRLADSTKTIPVCQKAFVGILQISKDRVLGVLKRFREQRQMACERRGGDRKTEKFAEKKASVMRFIEKFKTVEAHYCRNSSVRTYLPSDLNINEMWRQYYKNVETDPSFVMVKKSYFRHIFNSCYNIGFGSPRIDVCSTCLQLMEKIKIEKDEKLKKKLMTERHVHKLRAKAFFNLLREEREGLKTISFDCQKNQAMPKIPDQSVYYSRQLYTYNFAAVTGSSHSPLTKENVSLYSWTEDQHYKGADEIASAIFHKLCNINLDNIDTVRLIADGCGGQNKNSIMMTMCTKWLSVDAPPSVKNLELIFPVTGHSFIPPDRVFGRIEKIIKKKDTIVSPEEFLEIFKKHGTVFILGQDVEVYNWKQDSQNVMKPPAQWHFRFKMSKRFILRKGKNKMVTIRGEQAYRSDLGEHKSVFKKGKSVTNIIQHKKSGGVKPNKEKLKDVSVLLEKHWGENWQDLANLKYYSDVLQKYYNPSDDATAEDPECSTNLCERVEMIPDLIV